MVDVTANCIEPPPYCEHAVALWPNQRVRPNEGVTTAPKHRPVLEIVERDRVKRSLHVGDADPILWLIVRACSQRPKTEKRGNYGLLQTECGITDKALARKPRRR